MRTHIVYRRNKSEQASEKQSDNCSQIHQPKNSRSQNITKNGIQQEAHNHGNTDRDSQVNQTCIQNNKYPDWQKA